MSSALLDALETLAESAQPVPLEPLLLPALQRRLDEFLQWRLDRPLKTMGLGQGAGDVGRGKFQTRAPRPAPLAPIV